MIDLIIRALLGMVTTLLIGGLYALFKLRDKTNKIEGKVESNMESTQKALDDGVRQREIQFKSIDALRDAVSQQSVADAVRGQQIDSIIKEAAKESETFRKYHGEHFDKIEKIQIEAAEQRGSG